MTPAPSATGSARARLASVTAALAATATLSMLCVATPAAAALPAPPAQGVKMNENPGAPLYGHAQVVNDVATNPLQQWYAAGPGSIDSTPYTDYVIRKDIGRYTVWLAGLGPYGAALVTAVGGAAGSYCVVSDLVDVPNRDVPGTDVEIDCFGTGSLTIGGRGVPAGAAKDATFTLSYTYLGLTGPHQPQPPRGSNAYLRATRPTAPSYQPDLVYQYNVTGALNTVDRVGPGDYLIHLPGVDTSAGRADVTGYGPGNHRCGISDQTVLMTRGVVGVRCFTADGASADVPFMLRHEPAHP